MLHRFLFSFIFLSITIAGFSQASHTITDSEKDYLEAKKYFLQGDYALAYPLLKSLKEKYTDNEQNVPEYIHQDVNYYYLVCGLELNLPIAEEEAKKLINTVNSEIRQKMLSFYLAKYYFKRSDYARAAIYYEKAGFDNLSNEEIANGKFELAYSYFSMDQFEKAKPLFNEIHQMSSQKYYNEANYYYGYISFMDKNYPSALQSFKEIAGLYEYQETVPYYMAQIYYFQGEKENALLYAENALNGNTLSNQKELNLLIGQLYFEKKEFAKALPFLENYVLNSDRVTKEVMYELSYCYYDGNQTQKAIEGFKQLSNEQDSLGQNSMYLLGSLYLNSGQKVNARNAFQYSADNNSNPLQQEISKFNYAKLSYELGYNTIAMNSMNQFITTYPSSKYTPEAKEILIQLWANSNNYSNALNLYQSFENPSSAMRKVYPTLLYGRAVELFNEQKLPEADLLFTKILLDANSGKLKNLATFWKGEIAYRLNSYEEAINLFNQYLSSPQTLGDANPTNAKYSLGYSYLKTANYSSALENFQSIAPSIGAASPELVVDAYVRTADCYFMQKNYSVSKTMYQNIIDNNSAQSDYSMYQIALIEGISNSNQKIKTLNLLIQRYPQSELAIESNVQIANTYMSQEKYNEAIPFLNKVLSNPNAVAYFPKVYLKLGLSNYNMNKDAEALKYYQQLLTLYPQSDEAEEALENMENIYVKMGKPNEYIAFVKKSGKTINASKADSLTYEAAELKYINKDCTGALLALNNYLSQFPQGSFVLDANYLSSDCYSKNKDWDNAAKGYENIIAQGISRYSENATLLLARIYYFELKNYQKATESFLKLKQFATTPENELEALRGLVRSYYQTKSFDRANDFAKELLNKKGISPDDKAIANLVLGKSLQGAGSLKEAIEAFKKVVAISKSAWGDEARYEMAQSFFALNQLSDAEKTGTELIKVGSVDFWIAKAYILLGDIYLKQKDYFNAKATYKSVADNATIPELKKEAQEKLETATKEENEHSKILPNPDKK